jgi:hypothetical protein
MPQFGGRFTDGVFERNELAGFPPHVAL